MGKITLINGKVLHWNEYGLNTGAPVFYFHGIPGSSLEPRLADEIATDLGIRLIAPDLPGIGDSDLIDSFQLLDWPDMIEQLADYLAIDQFSILGFSGGGVFALACAYKIPDRVKQVSLVSCAAPFDTEVMQMHLPESFKQLYDLPIIDYQMAIDQFKQLASSAESLVQVMLSPFSETDQKIFADQVIYSSYKESFEAVLKQGVEGIVSNMKAVRVDREFDLKDIQQKTVIWQGLSDNAIHPDIGQYLADSLPNSTLHKVDNAGHFLHFSNWKIVLQSTQD
jgi:pimeloyl-ACP methyl ester carboxylesterase